MTQGITTALSAIMAYGRRMETTANNIANAQTPGFKKSLALLTDSPPETVATRAGSAQAGTGAQLGEISESFQSGGLIPDENATSMALAGDGFFVLRDSGGSMLYSREGHFNLDPTGRLTNAEGQVVQGRRLDSETGQPSGAPGDIQLSGFTAPPQATGRFRQIVNLDAGASDHSPGSQGLSAAWDGSRAAGAAMSGNAYAYQTTGRVYDQNGAAHDMTIYFDCGTEKNQWEYIVTVNPSEDLRAGATGADQGLLARGTLDFNASGAMTGMTMETNDGAGNWQAQGAAEMKDGHFVVTPDFTGAPDGGTALPMRIDLGLAYDGQAFRPESPVSTQYAASSTTVRGGADGYPPGDLQALDVKSNGVIQGRYTNGQTIDLFQVAQARFQNPGGLQKIGQNSYAATSAAGEPALSAPDMGGLAPRALEQSNVDYAEEFGHMTLDQIGFKANLHTIQAEDERLGDLLNIIS